VSDKNVEKDIIPCAIILNDKSGKKVEKDVILRTMTLNDNKIDYVHWDDPNKYMDFWPYYKLKREYAF